MLLLKLIIAIGLPALCGYALVGLTRCGERDSHPIEKLCVGYAAGLGVLTMEMFLLGLAGVRYTAVSVSVPLVVLTLIFIIADRFFSRRGVVPAGNIRGGGPAWSGGAGRILDHPVVKALCALVVLWICFKAAFVLYEGFVRPMASQDTWWNWSSGAKFFFYERGLNLDPSSEFFFARGYRRFLGYPLMNPLAQVWYSLVLGAFHESLAKAWVPFCYLSILGALFFSLKREAGTVISVGFVFLLSSAPLLTYHGIDAYSDLPLAMFVFLGGVMLFRHMETGGLGYAALAGLYFSMGVFTKNEGVVFLAASAVSVLVYSLAAGRGGIKGLAAFAIPAAVYLAPWVIFKAYYGVGYGHGSGRALGGADEASGILWTGQVHYEVVLPFFKELLLTANHALVFPFLALFTVICLRTVLRSNIKYLYLLVLLVISALLFVYTCTQDYVYVLNRMSVNRNAVAFLPLALYIMGVVASRGLRDRL